MVLILISSFFISLRDFVPFVPLIYSFVWTEVHTLLLSTTTTDDVMISDDDDGGDDDFMESLL